MRVEPIVLPKSEGQALVDRGVSAIDALAAVTENSTETPTASVGRKATAAEKSNPPEGMRVNSAGQLVPMFRLPSNS